MICYFSDIVKMKLTLYHYTDYSGYCGIMQSRTIRKTTCAHYGAGVYFTSMSPYRGKSAISSNNYRSGASKNMRMGRVDYYIEVEFDENDVNIEKVIEVRDIYRYKDSEVILDLYKHRFGVTP